MNASEFAHFIKGLGFRVWLAQKGTYGFISDSEGTRVLSFDEMSLSGNYGPPSRASGTGWRIGELLPCDLRTKNDVREALYAMPPTWCRRVTPQDRNGWEYLTTVEQYLAMYDSSSKFREI